MPDFGFTALWSQGDTLIHIVAIVLIAMSLVTWTIVVEQLMRQRKFLRAFRSTKGGQTRTRYTETDNAFHALIHLARAISAPGGATPAVDAICGATDEGHANAHRAALSARLAPALRAQISKAAEELRRGLPILASIGSTAPFVGLLGTVWGIYRALIGIGSREQSSIALDQIAGPIGEALVMTAVGLMVAIPAVLAYNSLARLNRSRVGTLERFARLVEDDFIYGDSALRNATEDRTPASKVNDGAAAQVPA